MLASLALSATMAAATSSSVADRVALLNSNNPLATFSADAVSPHHRGGCYNAPTPDEVTSRLSLYK